MHTYNHACMHVCMFAYMHTCILHTYIHTSTSVSMHLYIYIHISTYMCICKELLSPCEIVVAAHSPCMHKSIYEERYAVSVHTYTYSTPLHMYWYTLHMCVYINIRMLWLSVSILHATTARRPTARARRIEPLGTEVSCADALEKFWGPLACC